MTMRRDVINPVISLHPQHANLIGEMILGYSDLELTFCHVAGLVVNLKFEVLHASEQIISEIGKLRVISALARGAFTAEGLGQEFRTALTMMTTCATIRNRYAHSQWLDLGKRFYYVEGKEIFANPSAELAKKMLTLEILSEQRAYFVETRKWVFWLEYTLSERRKAKLFEKLNGGPRKLQEWTRPQTLPPPREHSKIPKSRRARPKKSRPTSPSRQHPKPLE